MLLSPRGFNEINAARDARSSRRLLIPASLKHILEFHGYRQSRCICGGHRTGNSEDASHISYAVVRGYACKDLRRGQSRNQTERQVAVPRGRGSPKPIYRLIGQVEIHSLVRGWQIEPTLASRWLSNLKFYHPDLSFLQSRNRIREPEALGLQGHSANERVRNQTHNAALLRTSFRSPWTMLSP